MKTAGWVSPIQEKFIYTVVEHRTHQTKIVNVFTWEPVIFEVWGKPVYNKLHK